ncbi:retrovirus-related pol polyprotein from transposon TNT 1-94 [Tanacetum coccineum]
MHNDIIAAGSETVHLCLQQGDMPSPYVITEITIPAKPATETEEAVPTHNVPKTYKNTSPENHAYFDDEAEAIHMILSGIGDDIYSIVDACTTTKDMWVAIERLQQGESLNKQDVKTNMFWECGKFISRDGELVKSYYSRLYNMMSEMNKVNKICAEKIAMNANPLALVVAAQHYLEYHNQATKPHKPIAPSSRQITSSKSHATTRNKGKEVVKPITPPSKSTFEEDSDEEQGFRRMAKECWKPKQVKDYVYHKEKMMLCKHEEKGPLEKLQFDDDYNVFTNERQHFEQPESINDTYVVEKIDSNVIPDSSDMCDNGGHDDQKAEEYDDERCKSALEESNDIRDRCRSALHHQEIELEKYKKYKNYTIENEEVERKLKETIGFLAQQKIDSNEALKTQAYETFQVKEKNAELVHQSSLEHIRYDRLQKEKEKLQQDFKLREEKDIDKLIALENQIPYDKDDLANIFAPNREETLTLEQESRSKLHKETSLDEKTELQCLYLEKIEECECLAIKLSIRTEHEQLKNDKVWKQQESSSFQDQKEQFFVIQDLKAQFQDKNIAISELKKLIEKMKGKYMDTKFEKPLVVRQPNAFKLGKPYVLGKPSPFSNSPFSKSRFSPMTNVNQNLSNPVTPHILHQNGKQTTSKNTNPRISTSIGVIHTTSVSRPQFRSTHMKEKVIQNNSQVKIKHKEVEDHHISSFSNKTKSVTACNDSLNSKTSNVNAVCVTCGNYVFNLNHDACVSKFINDVNARTKNPKIVPISTRKPKRKANQFVATPHKKTIASESTIQKSKSYFRMLYVNNCKTWTWWIEKQYPSGYKWMLKTIKKWVPKVRRDNVSTSICSTIDDASRITNVSTFTIELGSNMSNVPSSSNSLVDCSNHPIHLKRSSLKTKTVPSSKRWLNLRHMDLCGPMQIESINGKKYILVIVDDYSRYTWTHFMRSKDETPEVLKDFLKMMQQNLQAQMITIRSDIGIEFLNKTLHAYFKEEGIKHQTSTPQTTEHNDIVKRQNHTLVEAARMMLLASKLPLFFWAEAITTACYTQNRSLIIPKHDKIPYHIINERKPTLKHLHIFGCTCYLTRDDKMTEKGDPCILLGYSTQLKVYRDYNKRTRLIVGSIHINFDEIKELMMMFDHNSSNLAPQ